jgi:hypothetical protein
MFELFDGRNDGFNAFGVSRLLERGVDHGFFEINLGVVSKMLPEASAADSGVWARSFDAGRPRCLNFFQTGDLEARITFYEGGGQFVSDRAKRNRDVACGSFMIGNRKLATTLGVVAFYLSRDLMAEFHSGGSYA